MSAESWDGLGLEEGHYLPPDELLLSSVTLSVHAGTGRTTSGSSR